MNTKLLFVFAGGALALAACNQPVIRTGSNAEACQRFGATGFPEGSGISTTRSSDNRSLTILFDGMRAATGDGRSDNEDDESLSLSLEPDGCASSIKVAVRGFCQAADVGSARPSIGVKWAGEEWTGTPECTSDGSGYLLETTLEASAKADSALSATLSLATPSDAQLTIDAIDLTLAK